MNITPRLLRFVLNIYPPYFGAGVHIDHISDDWKSMKVSMNLRWYNRNAVKTHFGGSLYSMVDPHIMLMLMQILGKGYIVWDKAAHIEFLRPGRGKVRADIRITDEEIATIVKTARKKGKVLPEFFITIVDDSGEDIARVTKTLYVRKKPEKKVEH